MMLAMSHREVLLKRLSNLELKRSGVVVGLVGAPGIGKSHAARESLKVLKIPYLKIQANASDAVVARAWLEVLQHQSVSLPSWVNGLLERLNASEVLKAEAVSQVCLTLMQTLAPFALLIEDVHEASPAHLERFILLARGVSKNTALIVTSRNVLPEVFKVLYFETLSIFDMTVLLEQNVGFSLPQVVVDWIFARSKGNPLFSVEYLRDLQRHGFLSWQDGHCQWKTPEKALMPNTIEVLIEQVLDGLPNHQTRAALDAWAMLYAKTEYSSSLWAMAAGLSNNELQMAQSTLEQFGILNDKDFTHPLFREITLKYLSQVQRRDIARRLLVTLEASDPLRAVGFVKEATWSIDRTYALYCSAMTLETDELRLARLKAAALEFTTAEERFRLALEAAQVIQGTDLTEANRLSEIAYNLKPHDLEAVSFRSQMLVLEGQIQRAKDLLEGITPIDADSRPIEWCLKWCELLLKAQDFAGAWEFYQSHPAMNQQLSVTLQVQLARSLMLQREFAKAEQWLQQLEARTDLTLEERVRVISGHGALVLEHGQTAAAAQATQTAYALVEHLPNSILKRSMLLNRGIGFNWIGQYAKAEKDGELSIQLMLEAGQVFQAATARVSVCNNWVDQGHYAKAERGFLEARATLEIHESWRYLSECERLLVRLYHTWRPVHGSVLVLKHAKAAVHYARKIRLKGFVITALYWASISEIEFGQLEQAQAFCAELHELSHVDGRIYLWQWVYGLLLERQGDKALALDSLQAAIVTRDAPEMEDTKLMELEMIRIRGDLVAARVALEDFQAQGFIAGATLCLHYFPDLNPKVLTLAITSKVVRLNVLGSLQLIQDGTELPLRGAKRKLMLALLLEAHLAGQPEVRAADLGEALYPNATDDEARAAVKQLAFRLRSQIGVDTVQTTTNGYALQGVQSDAQSFLETSNADLWRGTYLTDVQGIEGYSLETVREALYSQLKHRAEDLLNVEPVQSARLARILMEAEPFDTSALALALRALQAQGNYNSISRMYKRSRETWLEVGERLPDKWIDFLGSTQVA
jgi:DNA-binding SARP family transcriptional activator/tetratricopeptide (TPR) repeat protein